MNIVKATYKNKEYYFDSMESCELYFEEKLYVDKGSYQTQTIEVFTKEEVETVAEYTLYTLTANFEEQPDDVNNHDFEHKSDNFVLSKKQAEQLMCPRISISDVDKNNPTRSEVPQIQILVHEDEAINDKKFSAFGNKIIQDYFKIEESYWRDKTKEEITKEVAEMHNLTYFEKFPEIKENEL